MTIAASGFLLYRVMKAVYGDEEQFGLTAELGSQVRSGRFFLGSETRSPECAVATAHGRWPGFIVHSALCRFVAAGSQVPELKRKLNESGYLTRPAGGGSYQRDTASDNRVSVPDRTSQRQRATHAAGTTFTPQFTTTSTRAATEHRLLSPAQGGGGVSCSLSPSPLLSN